MLSTGLRRTVGRGAPSSELHIAEDWYRRTAVSDLLQLPAEQVN